MRYIAYDSLDKHRPTPVCGPQAQSKWVRAVIESLLENHPELQLKPTQELLNAGEKFAYIVSWRYYYGYSEESNGPAHLRTVMSWLYDYPRLLNALRTGQGVLVFADWYEGVFGPRTLTHHHADKFMCFCTTYDIPVKNVIFADGNSAAPRFERPQTPRFVYANIFEWLSLSYVNKGLVPDPLVHPKNKPYRFLSYARHWNTMRQNFTFDLFDRDLLKYGLVSCSAQNTDGTSDFNIFAGSLGIWSPNVSKDKAKAFLQMLPLTLDADLTVNQATSCNVQHHLDTDVSIIHETHSNIETVFLSEKTYRAILLKHPFLMMGSPGLLHRLRLDGYQTYGELFDESYDEETNLLKRKEMVLAELTKFIRLDDATRQAKLDAAQEVAAVNQKHFLTQLDRPRFGRNLIEALKD